MRYASGHKVKIGDEVSHYYANGLHCGSGVYESALVNSVEPFRLVSEERDMTWERVKPCDLYLVFRKIEKKTKTVQAT